MEQAESQARKFAYELSDELIKWVRNHFPNVPVQSDGKGKPYLLPIALKTNKQLLQK